MKMEKKTDPEKNLCSLFFSGGLSLDDVAEMKEKIIPEIAGSQSLIIDLNQVNDIDLSVIQLLYSVYLSAMGKKIKFSIKGKNNQKVMARIQSSSLFLEWQ